MTIDSLKKVSVLVSVAYAIMCFEKYVVTVYPNVDFSPVAEVMWSIIDGSNYLDESSYRYIEIVPECLFEFKSYEESDFEYLSKEEYDLFTSILNATDHDLNVLMKSIYDIAMAYAYTTVESGAPEALSPLECVIGILSANDIALPDTEAVSTYTATGSDGLGDYFDGRYLSIILK